MSFIRRVRSEKYMDQKCQKQKEKEKGAKEINGNMVVLFIEICTPLIPEYCLAYSNYSIIDFLNG